jgi:hypothetical protein
MFFHRVLEANKIKFKRTGTLLGRYGYYEDLSALLQSQDELEIKVKRQIQYCTKKLGCKTARRTN